MKRASRIPRRQCSTVASQLIDSILFAAAAAGVADSSRVAALRAGVAVRSAGIQQSGRVSEKALLWLWGALADLAGGHSVGAELARFAGRSTSVPAEPTPFGLFGEVMTHAPSLADAFEHVVRYARLVHQGVAVEIDVDDRHFTVIYRHSGGDTNPSSGALAAGMLWANANLALLPERAFGVRLRPVSAELACVAAGDAGGVITDIFGTDVKFGTADWRLVFDRPAVLAVSRPAASSALPYLDAHADRELRDVPEVDDIIGAVAAEVRGRLAGRPPAVGEIARALGLSTRTLQRRLTVAGRDFAAVLDDVRRARAEALLADGRQNLAEIAYKLGYSEPSAFTRASIRWFRTAPSRTR
jgi:AraC-like DNA-binding protein